MFFLSLFNLLTPFDTSVIDFIQNMRCGFLDIVMAVFSYVGESGGIWLIAALIMIPFKKTRATGAMIICAVLAGFLIGEFLLKNLAARPRPFVVNPDIVLTIKEPSGYSFPSGHSCSSFAAATVLLMRDKRFGFPALALACLIAFSRLYNYVHYPSDVICGILLGILCAVLTVIVFRKTGFDKKLSKTLLYKKGEEDEKL